MPEPTFRYAQIPRLIAALLAIGGTVWAVLLAAVFGPFVLISPFLPGYILTAAYFVRTVTTPALDIRRVGWVASLLIQAIWLMIGLADIGRGISIVLIAWWSFATLASFVALITESDEPAPANAQQV